VNNNVVAGLLFLFRKSVKSSPHFPAGSITIVPLKKFQNEQLLFLNHHARSKWQPHPPVTSLVASPVPTTIKDIDYLPISLRWDATEHDACGLTSLGLGYSLKRLVFRWASTICRELPLHESRGHLDVFCVNAMREQTFITNWP